MKNKIVGLVLLAIMGTATFNTASASAWWHHRHQRDNRDHHRMERRYDHRN